MKPNIVCDRCKDLGLFTVVRGCRCKVGCVHPTEHVTTCHQCVNELWKRKLQEKSSRPSGTTLALLAVGASMGAYAPGPEMQKSWRKRYG